MGIAVKLSERQIQVFERIAKALEELVELQKAESILRSIPPPPPPTQPEPFKPSVPDPLEWWRNVPTVTKPLMSNSAVSNSAVK